MTIDIQKRNILIKIKTAFNDLRILQQKQYHIISSATQIQHCVKDDII